MDKDKIYLVTNRSASRVFYSIPDLHRNREFQPGETKKITYEELEQLNFQPGGNVLLRDYLFLQDPEAAKTFIGKVEPEYNMTAVEVKELILNGSMDEWLDCLDFAPEGVIDLIKTLSVELPLTDTRKMQAFKEKKGIDLMRAIQAHMDEQEPAQEPAAQRRTAEVEEKVSAQPERRTSGSKYKVVSRQEV